MNFKELIESYQELVEYVHEKDDRGNTQKVHFTTLTVNGQELLGKKCRLIVGIWTNDEGGQSNEIVKVMQLGGGAAGPKRPSKAPATAQAAPAQQASRPPARPAAPAPRVPDVEPMFDNDGNELPY